MENLTEEDYLQLLKKLKSVFVLAEKTQDFSDFYTLAKQISAYEKRDLYVHEPLDPIEILELRMQEKGFKVSDLANVYGTEQMVKDVLDRKRQLSINMIRAYGEILQIPSRALIQSYYYQVA